MGEVINMSNGNARLSGLTTYIGVKILGGKPMTRGEYCKFRGWELPADENGDDAGSIVQYKDGYISWSPAQQFDDAYRETSGMPFGLAVEAMKKGCKVARSGWNGVDMFLYLVPGSEFKVNRAPLLGIYPEGTEIKYRPHMDLKTADGTIATWSPSGSDALADDWKIVGEPDVGQNP